MELITHTIQTNELKCRSNIQATLEDDMNVPAPNQILKNLLKHKAKYSLQM